MKFFSPACDAEKKQIPIFVEMQMFCEKSRVFFAEGFVIIFRNGGRGGGFSVVAAAGD